jgi:hypothetical protein
MSQDLLVLGHLSIIVHIFDFLVSYQQCLPACAVYCLASWQSRDERRNDEPGAATVLPTEAPRSTILGAKLSRKTLEAVVWQLRMFFLFMPEFILTSPMQYLTVHTMASVQLRSMQ